MKKFPKYGENLSYDNNYVYSYGTCVAKIDRRRGILRPLGYWSMTTSKHINYAAKQLGLQVGKIKAK